MPNADSSPGRSNRLCLSSIGVFILGVLLAAVYWGVLPRIVLGVLAVPLLVLGAEMVVRDGWSAWLEVAARD